MAAERQVASMVQFIREEATKQVSALQAQTAQAYQADKSKLIQDSNDKAKKTFDNEIKKLETQRAILRSTSVNKSRLQKVAERAKHLDFAVEDVKGKLAVVTKDANKYKALLTKLIAQGCLKLLETEVQVRCRAADKSLVQGCLPEAEAMYGQTLTQGVGKARRLKLSVHPLPLPPAPSNETVNSCLGGVILCCHNGLITVDNTLDTRLRLVVEQDKPTIRATLFPN